jgi:Recombinase
VVDETKRPYLVGMVERVIAGTSLTAVADWLDSEGQAPRHSGAWSAKSVSQILRNSILHGQIEYSLKGRRSMISVDPVITRAQFAALQAKLDAAGSNRRAPSAVTTERY